MKTAVVYYSKHHGNTKKVLDAIAARYDMTLIDATETPNPSLEEYDLVGFASGIYYSKFHKTVLNCIKNCLPQGKKTFLVYTYGAEKKGYPDSAANAVAEKGGTVLGEYGCFGFNTFGPFKLIGGMAKGHPDQGELTAAVKFYEGLLHQ